MTAMSPEPAHARPNTWKRWLTGDSGWFALATVLTIGVAACGFVLSFTNLGDGARADGWHPWWLLPLSIDTPVPVFVVADHYLVSRGYRSLYCRACAWGFAALTVALNGAPADSALWHYAKMAAPAAWVLGIEAVRRMVKAYRLGARPPADRAPLTEWLGALGATRRLWRRKLALGVTAWSEMRDLEEARLLVADLAAAREDAGAPVPAAVDRAVRTGRLPAHLAEAVKGCPATEWEPLVTRWAAQQIALPSVLLAAITDASSTLPAGPEAVPQTSPVARSGEAPEHAPGTPQTSPRARPARARKLAPSKSRSMTADDLVPHVLAMIEEHGTVSQAQVKRDLHVSTDKAREALKLALAQGATVTPINRAARG